MANPQSPSHWLVKQEPSSYSWEQFRNDRRTVWDGVRNFQARNNLRAMRAGDHVLFYRSVDHPAVVGVCQVVREAYPDPTAEDGDWSVVDLAVRSTLPREVSLAEIKANPQLADIALLKQSRLSVMPLDQSSFQEILRMAEQKG